MPQTTITRAAQTLAQPSQPLDKHPVACYLADLQSPRSRYVMQNDLHNLAKMMSGGQHDEWSFEWHKLRFQHLNALRGKLLETDSFVTVNKKLAAVRGVLRAARMLRLIGAEDYADIREVKRAKGQTVAKGRSIGAGELHALFSVCAADREGNPAAAARDAALLAVMYSVAGPRRSEIVALDLSDYNAETGHLLIRSGKGNKARTNYLGEESREAVNDWIALRGSTPGALFCAVNKGGNIVLQRMSSQAIWNIVEKRAQQAGVENIAPHDFRRTCAGDLLDRGVDIATVKQLMGHANIETTAKYDRRGEKRKQKAAELLHVPYSS